MTEFIYAIIRDHEIVTTKRLPERADPGRVRNALGIQEDINSGRDLSGFYHDYLVVDKTEAAFELAQYRVIRFPHPKYVVPVEDDSWRHDSKKAFQIFEIQFGTIH